MTRRLSTKKTHLVGLFHITFKIRLFFLFTSTNEHFFLNGKLPWEFYSLFERFRLKKESKANVFSSNSFRNDVQSFNENSNELLMVFYFYCLLYFYIDGRKSWNFFSLYYWMLLPNKKKNHFILDLYSTFNDEAILINVFLMFYSMKMNERFWRKKPFFINEYRFNHQIFLPNQNERTILLVKSHCFFLIETFKIKNRNNFI